MSSPWTVEKLLHAAGDSTSRITVGDNAEVRIDGWPASRRELELLAQLVASGLVDLNLTRPAGSRCCWITAAGKKQRRRWGYLAGAAR
ncbi:hypothetical protein DI005_20050 [Prauserella sp. PE36]|uniref:hypothetical protein n=1 Tax=Prauserella sp. PE36 TaxID=1504709 RepID=UPI000DE25000|nr:hypothetical protein [Prauserella sp. PE36]RBM18089.1 hypothetical protein DI005_20050 [Prauserella sp. PE36]